MKAFISTVFFLLVYLSSQGQTINPFENKISSNHVLMAASEYEKTIDFSVNTCIYLPITHEFKTCQYPSGHINSKKLNKKRKRKWARHSPPKKHFSQRNKLMNQKQSNNEQTEKVISFLIDITLNIIKGYCLE
jgi:hypothetical protein